ncbi:hypothetical protein OK016_26360 [Vibrio chagasii]|nr:hypothetical protein [Vibrio chagasii]
MVPKTKLQTEAIELGRHGHHLPETYFILRHVIISSRKWVLVRAHKAKHAKAILDATDIPSMITALVTSVVSIITNLTQYPFLKVAQQLDVLPSDCVMLKHALIGQQAAK